MKNQIIVRAKGSEARLYLDLPHFKNPKYLGSIFRDSQTLRTIPRGYDNLFHLFGKAGLGVNAEILSRFLFEFIEIPFNNQILKTTKQQFLMKSILSPYQSDRVDKQRILFIDDFIILEDEPEKVEDLQLSLI